MTVNLERELGRFGSTDVGEPTVAFTDEGVADWIVQATLEEQVVAERWHGMDNSKCIGFCHTQVFLVLVAEFSLEECFAHFFDGVRRRLRSVAVHGTV